MFLLKKCRNLIYFFEYVIILLYLTDDQFTYDFRLDRLREKEENIKKEYSIFNT